MKKWVKIIPVIIIVLLLALFFIFKFFDIDDSDVVEKIINVEEEITKEEIEEMSEEELEDIKISEEIIKERTREKMDKNSISEDDIASGNFYEGILEKEPVFFEPDLPKNWTSSMTDKIEGYFTMENHQRIKKIEEVYEIWRVSNNLDSQIEKEIEVLNLKMNILNKRNDFHNYVYYLTNELRDMLGPTYANMVNDENMYDEYVLTYIEHYDEKKEMAMALNFKESTWKEDGETVSREIHHFITVYKKVKGEWKIYYEIPFLTGEQQEVYKVIGGD